MIFQHFAPISPILEQVLIYCRTEKDPYFDQQYLSDAADVSALILANKKMLESTLDHIAELTKEDKIVDYIRNLEPEYRFLLYTAIRISFLHFDAGTEKLPILPPENFYPLIAAYVQESFISFERHCLEHKLLLWEQVLEYELDMAADPNF